MSADVLLTPADAPVPRRDTASQPRPGSSVPARLEAGRANRELHARLTPVVRRVIRKVLGSDREFEDVVQDSFVRILYGLSRRAPDDIERWAARVTLNTVYNTLRRRRYRRVTSWNPHEEPDLVAWHPDEHSPRVVVRVERVVSRLPGEQRRLLERRWSGATMETLAAEHACSLRTVKRRMHGALRNFDLHVRRDPEVSSWLSARGGDALAQHA
jgi:RNA polymerase sigma factor (sigma-70 family)